MREDRFPHSPWCGTFTLTQLQHVARKYSPPRGSATESFVLIPWYVHEELLPLSEFSPGCANTYVRANMRKKTKSYQFFATSRTRSHVPSTFEVTLRHRRTPFARQSLGSRLLHQAHELTEARGEKGPPVHKQHVLPFQLNIYWNHLVY